MSPTPMCVSESYWLLCKHIINLFKQQKEGRIPPTQRELTGSECQSGNILKYNLYVQMNLQHRLMLHFQTVIDHHCIFLFMSLTKYNLFIQITYFYNLNYYYFFKLKKTNQNNNNNKKDT